MENIKEQLINYFKVESIFNPHRKEVHDKWIAWLEKQGEKSQVKEEKVDDKFERPFISPKWAPEVVSRFSDIDDDLKPIVEFIIGCAHWNLHKDEWNQPTLEVPLFRVLDAFAQKGKPYCGG
jgi:hypothetical protein